MDYVLMILALAILATTGFLVRFPSPAERRAAVARAAAARHGRARWAETRFSLGLVFGWLAVLALVVALVLTFNHWPTSRNIVELILLCRYSLAVAVLLAGLVLLGQRVAPRLLSNLFALQGPWQLFHVTWMALLVATMVLATTRIVELNAPVRYGTTIIGATGADLDLRSESWGLLRTVVAFLLGLPVPYACLRTSLLEVPTRRPLAWALIGLGGGTAMALLLLLLTATVAEALVCPKSKVASLFPLQTALSDVLTRVCGLQPGPVAEAIDAKGVALLRLLDERGYVEGPETARRLAPGHAQVSVGMLIVFVVYLVSYAVVSTLRLVPNGNFRFPPVCFVLLLLLLVGFLLQGVAFALDLFRFPVLLAVGLFSFLLYWFNRTDHYYNLRPDRAGLGKVEESPVPSAPTFQEAALAWRIPAVTHGLDLDTGQPSEGKDRKTLVVVTASGGGIQAAAWAARVLVGLHQRYGDDFTRSLGLLSAVSGGSVGVMYYLDQLQADGPPLLPQALALDDWHQSTPGSICGRAMASSLDATAWGLVFPDLLRSLFPPLVSLTDDRGSRIEDAWRSRLDSHEARLQDWAIRIRDSSLPTPVFNATLVETGQRLLCSPVVSGSGGDPAIATSARELLTLYPTARPRVSTAVRLSATFPFISPICRPLPLRERTWSEEDAYHCADGGYADNEGMTTALTWLDRLLEPSSFTLEDRRRAFDQILLVRIMPFPDDHVVPAQQNAGWVYSLLGPIDTLQNVRVASQAERNDFALDLFVDTARRRGVRVESTRFTFNPPVGHAPPLSWMLTDSQKDDIQWAWNEILNSQTADTPLSTLDRIFK